MKRIFKTKDLNVYSHSRYITGMIFFCLLFNNGLTAQEPSSVTITGSFQSEIGCSGDWMPDCAASHLSFDANDGVWQNTFNIPAGSWEYKAALNNSWDENYGVNAGLNGSNISLNLASETDVKFYYDHVTHWVTDNLNSLIVTAPGNYQSEIGCPGDWDPSCLRSWLKDPDGDGIYSMDVSFMPPGDYEVKITIDENWSENYGAGGVPNGPNIFFTVDSYIQIMRFEYDHSTHILTIAEAPPLVQPGSVTLAGSFQSELGCSGDWQPDCAAAYLTFDVTDGVWQEIFNIPAGNWEYKAALDNSWDENYGANAGLNGSNIKLSLAYETDVKFYYDHITHWVTDEVNSRIVTAPGSYQSEIGCEYDWQPSCLRSWLKDPDGDNIFTFSTNIIPPGNYETKATINESWDENYGLGGVAGGANIPFTVFEYGNEVLFSFDGASNVMTVTVDGQPPENLPPVISASLAEITVDEGLTAEITGTVSDPDGDLISLSASVGTLINNEDGTWSWSFITSDGPLQSQTVIITADDGYGTASATFELTVNNVSPTIHVVEIPMDPVAISDVVTASATFSDPAASSDQPYTCSIDYGDGTVLPGIVDEWTCSFPGHTYTLPGVYEITVTVTDKDMGSSTMASSRYLVVYDPAGGFVTGGGWILSPPDAYKPDPSLTGMANFGFVSKYKKGSSIPDGNTEFKFNAANLNFKSSNYEWLVIAGSMAQFKGSGTINNEGDFGFLLSATDAGLNPGIEIDKFRIKIWDKDSDMVIYDNNIESTDDNAVPATEISGGSIVIHSAKSKKAVAESLDNPELVQPNFNIYPNPFTDQLNFEFSVMEDSYVIIEMFDIKGSKVKTVFENEVKSHVAYKENFIVADLVDGIYFYRITIGNTVYNGKVVNVKQ